MIPRELPNDQDAELSVLSACMHFNQALARTVEQLSVDDFVQPFSKKLFVAITELFKQRTPIDLITLRGKLPPEYFQLLVDCYSAIPAHGHTEHHLKHLKDLTTRRQAILVMLDTVEELYTQQAEGPMSAMLSKLMRQQSRDPVVKIEPLAEVMARQRDKIIELSDRRRAGDDTDERPVTFGIESVDDLITMTRDTYLLLGARPSAGKTSLALQLALHNAQAGRRILFFSLEMSADDIAKKTNTQTYGIPHQRQNRGYLNDAERRGIIDEAARAASRYPGLLINDRAGLTVAQMQSSLIRAQQEGPVDCVIIDHLIKVRSSMRGEASKHAQLSQISNDLREMVRNNRIPVVCLTQLRRPQQGHEDRPPELTDLRESGSLEEDADVIALLHRPSREGHFTPATLTVGKNRNGPVGRCSLLFSAMYVKFQPDTFGESGF